MRKNTLLAALAVCAAGFAGTAHAAIQTLDLDLFALADNGVGNTFLNTQVGTATITYDDTDIASGVGEIAATNIIPFLPEIDFTATVFGQTFVDADDPDAFIRYDNGVILDFNIAISEISTINPVPIDDARIIGFSTFTGGIDYATSGNPELGLTVNDINAVPLPAAAWMMLTGLVGMGVMARRKAS